MGSEKGGEFPSASARADPAVLMLVPWEEEEEEEEEIATIWAGSRFAFELKQAASTKEDLCCWPMFPYLYENKMAKRKKMSVSVMLDVDKSPRPGEISSASRILEVPPTKGVVELSFLEPSTKCHGDKSCRPSPPGMAETAASTMRRTTGKTRVVATRMFGWDSFVFVLKESVAGR